jgi:hypothetical protein
MIKIKPLGLDVRPIRPSDIGSLIPVQSHPFKTFIDYVYGSLYLTGQIGILDTEDERTSGVPGKKPVIHSGLDIAYMHVTGRAWRYTYSHGFGHFQSFTIITLRL